MNAYAGQVNHSTRVQDVRHRRFILFFNQESDTVTGKLQVDAPSFTLISQHEESDLLAACKVKEEARAN